MWPKTLVEAAARAAYNAASNNEEDDGWWPDLPVEEQDEWRRAVVAVLNLDRPLEEAMNKVRLMRLVDRFLAWKLPPTVNSDRCVTDPSYPHPRTGTNLLTADETRQMLEYLLVDEIETPEQRIHQMTDVELCAEWVKWDHAVREAKQWGASLAAADSFRGQCARELQRRGVEVKE